MRAPWAALFGIAASAGCGNGMAASPDAAPADARLIAVDRAHLSNVGTTGRLDYGDAALWLCRPDIDPSECRADLDATEFLPDGTRRTEPHVRADHPAFDCFYVYPTVSFAGGNVTNFSDVSAQLDPLLSQAARFSRICEVYAPLYRQVSLALGGGFSGDPLLAVQDARDAFQYYLAHLNRGRNFVILGHSQGSAVLTQVVHLDVEGHPEVLARMISAVLLGGEIRVADPPAALAACTTLFQQDCASFPTIPLCAAPGDTQCVIAYSSYRAQAPPDPATAVFGRRGTVAKTACVNPRVLAGSAGRFRGSYIPVHFVNPLFAPTNAQLPADITTPFALDRTIFAGDCVDETIGGVGFTYLKVALQKDAGDVRPDPPYYSSVQESIGFGLHVADYNLALDDLIDAVAAQAAAMR
ncbi:MAG TPA: DUF3089 domain-containing protein [Haliangiales bacterium]|nr:DUF3089 domain-containing protein [Haliangiales bacterium]